MQVGKLNFGSSAPAIFGSRGQSTAAATQSGVAALLSGPDNSDPTGVAGASYRQILARYDVNDISPREFSQMIHELHAAGAVNDSELQELTSIRFDLDKAEYSPDEKIDLVSLFGARLQQLRQSSDAGGKGDDTNDQSAQQRAANLATTKKQVDWLQKFATLHAENSTESLNTLV